MNEERLFETDCWNNQEASYLSIEEITTDIDPIEAITNYDKQNENTTQENQIMELILENNFLKQQLRDSLSKERFEKKRSDEYEALYKESEDNSYKKQLEIDELQNQVLESKEMIECLNLKIYNYQANVRECSVNNKVYYINHIIQSGNNYFNSIPTTYSTQYQFK